MVILLNTAVRLSEGMVIQAKSCSKAMNRSVAKQIEYWAKIGKVAEENTDLPYNFMKEMLLGQKEAASHQLEPYIFDS
jgi:ParD-like antitoxin of type II bacterial toxin-antitoxin system